MRNRKHCLSHLRYGLLFPGTGILYIAVLKVTNALTSTYLHFLPSICDSAYLCFSFYRWFFLHPWCFQNIYLVFIDVEFQRFFTKKIFEIKVSVAEVNTDPFLFVYCCDLSPTAVNLVKVNIIIFLLNFSHFFFFKMSAESHHYG
jgi:hypothetical protein